MKTGENRFSIAILVFTLLGLFEVSKPYGFLQAKFLEIVKNTIFKMDFMALVITLTQAVNFHIMHKSMIFSNETSGVLFD